MTDSSGAFSIQIDASVIGGVGATASRPGYGAATKKLTVVATSGANDFTLQFDLQSTVQPAFVRSGQPVTVSGRTTAPPTTAPSGYACTVGASSNGDLGNGSTTSSSTPVTVSGLGGSASLSGVRAIAANTFHKLVLRVDGTVMAWGYNGDGALGNGNTTDSSTPVVVKGVGGSGSLSGVTAISAGGFTAMALRSDGTVVDWGRNPEDELGNGTTADSSTPVVVSGVGGIGSLTGVTAIAAGYDFSLALRSDGTVVAWGYNGDAALGDGTTNPSSTPVVVSGVGGTGSLTGVTAISAGGYFGMALRSDGTVVAWGDGGYGQLGDGIPVESPTPVVVSGVGGSGSLTGVTAISAGGYSGMALRSDGTVVDWGQNNYGQLGNGTTTDSWTPVVVSGVGGSGSLTGVTAISAGSSTGMALLSSGTVVDWGQNNGGSVGGWNYNQLVDPGGGHRGERQRMVSRGDCDRSG